MDNTGAAWFSVISISFVKIIMFTEVALGDVYGATALIYTEQIPFKWQVNTASTSGDIMSTT